MIVYNDTRTAKCIFTAQSKNRKQYCRCRMSGKRGIPMRDSDAFQNRPKINKIMAFAIAFTMLFASQVTAFAATTSSKTVTSSKAMSVALLPGVTGNSNTITFNFNSLPDKAIVKEVEIDCSNASVIGGKGAILAKSLTITSPSGETHTVSWGKGNVTTTNLFIAEKAAGTWSVYMTGTNIASPNLGSAFIGGTKYSSVKMKVSYILED